MSNPPPSRTADKIIIRLPDGLRDRLAAFAKLHGNTMTAEVVELLEEALAAKEGSDRVTISRLLDGERKRESRLLAELEATQGIIRDLEAALESIFSDGNPAGGKLPSEVHEALSNAWKERKADFG